MDGSVAPEKESQESALGKSTRVADSQAHQSVTAYENTDHKIREAKHLSEEGYTQVVPSENAVQSARVDESMTKPSLQEKNLGTRCTRADGRSWQCRRTSLPGFALCEHHHVQLSNQSRRQRSFQRAFNHSSRKRLRKRDSRTDTKVNAVEGKSATDSGRWKARSLNAIVRDTKKHVESSDSSS
ncbi:hypothetical protein R1sor_009727 [Riccia sorocarpa]|uniref:WRC domain-containing protein n=1 Tax=Riccia sorocarpa TaxID=122646 RepID=A0ABD3I016_9MARC